jgi:ABC-2 type transport system permease protein
MMSGLFTSVENMPVWAQNINVINPVAYFIKVMRLVLLKGSGFFDIIHEIIALVIYAIAILSLATWRYQKTS